MKFKAGIYRHYKGELYEVLGVSRHSDTLEVMVVYQALYTSKEFGENALWVRPLEDFLEMIVVAEKEQPRFEFISEAMISSSSRH